MAEGVEAACALVGDAERRAQARTQAWILPPHTAVAHRNGSRSGQVAGAGRWPVNQPQELIQ